MNPMQIIQMMRSGNPQQVAANILRQSNNPMAVNALNMLENNDSKGLKQLAENLCKSRGTTIDAEIQRIQNQFGLK